jgi:hypothetical protein
MHKLPKARGRPLRRMSLRIILMALIASLAGGVLVAASGAAETTRLQDAMAKARELLKQKEVVYPSPPSTPLECKTTEALMNAQTVKDFVAEASAPEIEVITLLQDARKEKLLLGTATAEDNTYGLELQLVSRLKLKAERLLQDYRRQLDRRKKLPAIAAFARRTGQMLAVLGDAASEEALTAKLSDWVANLLPLMLRELKVNHDYRQVRAIYNVTRIANLTGVNTGRADIDTIYGQIIAAMHFDLTLNFSLRSTGANGFTEDWKLTGAFPISYIVAGGKEGGTGAHEMVVGGGTGKYDRYDNNDASSSRLTMSAPPFAVEVKIEDFDPCAGTANVQLDRFYADEETYKSSAHPEPVPLPVVKTGWTLFYGDRLKGGLFSFELPLANLAPTAIDSSIDATAGVFSGTLAIKLVHTPQ